MITVFTNGCFSLLHPGHVRLLQFARSQGDRLVVGINSDESMLRIKGRYPILPAIDRLELLSSLKWVDDVAIFYEDTPVNLIRDLHPEVLVKGPECRGKLFPGAREVLDYGGRVICPDWPIDHSSSELERMLYGQNCCSAARD